LIELLVSLVVLGVGMIGLSKMYVAGMTIYLKSKYTAVVAQRLQYELDQAESLHFNVLEDAANLIDVAKYPAADGYSELPTANGVQFDVPDLPRGHGTVTVSHYREMDSILLVTIQISWNGGHNLSFTDSTATLLVK